MISIVSDGRCRPLKDKRGLVLRDTSTKRRNEFNIALRDTDRCFVKEDANISNDSFIEKKKKKTQESSTLIFLLIP